ncbi:MAG: LamG-like jellyroll fold domain-containing protein, partial [Planctomycetota bacterium]
TLSGTGWRHIAYTVDTNNNIQRIYIDGVLLAEGNETASIGYNLGTSTVIGAHPSDSTYDFDGEMDDVRVYSRALSSDEIAALATDQSEVTDSVAITLDSTNDAPTFELPGERVFIEGEWGYGQNQDSLVLSNGSMLITPYDAGGDSALVKLNADGTIDMSFGTAGYADNSSIGYIESVAEQADGKILVSGDISGDIFVARYNADGTVDTSFGTGGVTTLPTGSFDEGNDVTVQSDGSIVLVGEYGDDSIIARFTSTGTLDASFGTGGIVTVNLGNTFENLESVTVLDDGSIVAVGETSVVKLDSSGNLDTSFDADGILDLGDDTYSVTHQADGKFVVSGGDGSGLFVTRFNADGTIDTDFGTAGTATWSTATATGYSVAQQADGKLVVAGHTDGYPTQWVAVRFNTDGSLDTTFADNGASVQDTSIDFSEASSVSIYNDGTSEKIVIGGYTTRDGFDDSSWLSMVRLNHDGSFDTSLSTNTLDGNPTFTEGGSPVVLDEDVQVFDAELSDIDDFGGATLTLARTGGTNADDVFSAENSMAFNGGNVEISSVPVATYSQVGGTLTITFNAGTTNAQVNEVMQSIAYEFVGATAPSDVQIDWTFNDGDSGAQGGPTALQATGSTTVIITNDIVDGTAGNDVIDNTYVDPTDGEMVDNADSTGPSGNEDVIHAGAGNDIIISGDEADTILGEAGDDIISTGGFTSYTPSYGSTSGSSGTLTGLNGNSNINYTVVSDATLNTSGNQYFIQEDGVNWAEDHTHTFSQPVAGAQLEVFDLGHDSSGPMQAWMRFHVDGQLIDLNQWIADGRASVSLSGNT